MAVYSVVHDFTDQPAAEPDVDRTDDAHIAALIERMDAADMDDALRREIADTIDALRTAYLLHRQWMVAGAMALRERLTRDAA